MEEIVKTTRYWLFKKSFDLSTNYFIRIKTDGIATVSWSIGYKNDTGHVSLIGGPLSDFLSISLENEFQEQINENGKEMLKYKI